jgi:secondary thiamine-phosphate synthase enzyme
MFHRGELDVATSGRGFHDITRQVTGIVGAGAVRDGVATVFIHHTSASVILCENADPTVRRDLEAFAARLVRDGDPLFEHTDEGDDDMPAHVRSVLTGSSVVVPVADGRLALGTWQGIYLWEHRTSPHRRHVTVTVVG